MFQEAPRLTLKLAFVIACVQCLLVMSKSLHSTCLSYAVALLVVFSVRIRLSLVNPEQEIIGRKDSIPKVDIEN